MDQLSNDVFIDIGLFFLEFLMQHSIAFSIVLLLLISLHVNMKRLKNNAQKIQCNCNYCEILADKLKKIVDELVSSENYEIIFLFFSIMVGGIFYILEKQFPLEENTRIIFTLLGFVMYFIALISNIFKITFVRKFNKIF